MSKTTIIIREGESCQVTCINPGKVRSLVRSLPRTSAVERISSTFQIMGDSSRLKILYCVSQGDVCVCDLSTVLGMNVSAVSHQLRLLRTLNLVKPRRDGRIVYYSLSDEHVGELMRMGPSMNAKANASERELCSVHAAEDSESVWGKHRVLVVAASTALFGAGFAVEYLTKIVLYGHAIFLAVILFSGRGIIGAAVSSVIRRRLDVNFLMTVAAFGAFAIGQADEGAAVMYLFSLAEYLENVASGKVRSSIAGLLKLSPSSATIRVDGGEVEKHIHDVRVGDVAIVRPGQRIPVDGVVVSGSSSVNQALITGESVPVEREVGSEVFAGSINEEGFLEIRATSLATETVISKVVKLVQQAQSERSPTESFVERFAKYYTPLVVAGSISVALVPPLVLGANHDSPFYSMIEVME